MRKVDDGKRKKRKKREKNGVFSGHYVIASSLPPERRPLERRTLVPIPYRSCNVIFSKNPGIEPCRTKLQNKAAIDWNCSELMV